MCQSGWDGKEGHQCAGLLSGWYLSPSWVRGNVRFPSFTMCVRTHTSHACTCMSNDTHVAVGGQPWVLALTSTLFGGQDLLLAAAEAARLACMFCL